MMIAPKLKAKVIEAFQSNGVALSVATPATKLRSTLSLLRPKLPVSIELIRIGDNGDGGYLIPNDLNDLQACLSPGVDEIANFEKELGEIGIPSHLVDFSVDAPPKGIRPASFTQKFIGAATAGNLVTLADWMSSLGLDDKRDLILQMDIEGAEYHSILATPQEVLDRFRIIVLEIHSLRSLANKDFHQIFHAFAQKLTKNHQVVHIHPNNFMRPTVVNGVVIHPVVELTLLRRDRFSRSEQATNLTYPHKLDRANMPGWRDYPLANDWYEIDES